MSEPGVHFTLAELTRTDTGLPNVPDDQAYENLVRLCADALEPAREMLGPLKINSGYRSPAVNRMVGGVASSAHVDGRAADFVPLKVSLMVAFDLIANSSIPYDQLIIEPAWLHLGIAKAGVAPRKQLLKAVRTATGMVYERVAA